MAHAEIQIKLTEVDRAKELFAAAAQRIEQLEAAISSVRALASEFNAADCDGCNAGDIVTDILAALDSSETPPPCPDCGPGYRLGDEGCRHAAPVPEERSDEAPKKPAAARSPWHDCPVCGNWPCDEHREES